MNKNDNKNTKNSSSVDKRQASRRLKSTGMRELKTNRRLTKIGRRKEDLTNNITYFITMVTLLILIISWVAYSTYLYVGEIAK